MQELDAEPQFAERDLVNGHNDPAETRQQALWDVVFTRISGVQEYGYHAGLEDLMWATDALGEGLATLDWPVLREALTEKRAEWTSRIMKHAKDEGVFFAHSSGNGHMSDELDWREAGF